MGTSRSFISFVLVALVLSLLAPGLAGARLARAQDGCEDALPPRLVPGERAQVSETDGQPLNVRGTASRGADRIGQLVEGSVFDVIEGPICADGLYWWAIETPEIAGMIAEGADGVYFVEPLGEPFPTPSQDIGPGAAPGAAGPFAAWDWDALSESWRVENLPDPMLLTVPPVYAGDLPSLPVNLSAVRFVEDAALNDAQLAILAENGFVVVPAGFKQFHEAYAEMENWWTLPPTYDWQDENAPLEYGHAYFVTTDAMLHALHFIFDNLLTDLEYQRFAPIMVSNVLKPALEAAHAQTAETVGTPLADVARKAELYLAVGLELYAPGEAAAIVGADLAAEAESVAALALAGEGQVEIPFLAGYREDFSQYRPRGHYAGDEALERYFRGTMWLSRITFLTNDPSSTQIALLLLRALQTAPGAQAGWDTLHDTLTFLVGPSDDLGPREYAPLAEGAFGAGLPLDALADSARIEAFQALLAALPGPRVNGLIVPDDTTAEDLESLTKGFRFMGQRFTLDGYLMQQVMYPYVGTREMPRLLPLGLDVPAGIAGSETALALAHEAGAGEFANYDAQIMKLASEMAAVTDEQWLENTYGGWLWALRPLWERVPGDAAYPPLMQSEAWLRKDLQTGLASWTELKHDTVLYIKQPTGFGGGGPPLTSFGYVEPNPLVFARMAILSGMLAQGLEARGFTDDLWAPDSVRRLVEMLRTHSLESARMAEVARKELAGEPITEDEYWMIFYVHNYLFTVLYGLWQGEGEPDPVALITDVASNPSAGTALQEAVGDVDYIYAVVTLPDGTLQLTRGGVFSYYEFVHDINDRMTDDAWRAQVASGDLPPRPAWTSAFFSE